MTKQKHTKFINLADPLVSILVPTYNRKWLLPRTLQSLLNQSYRNIEIMLINDFGEDVQDIVSQFNDSRINYLQNPSNLGLAGARNTGLKNCTGDRICLCDDDDIYMKYAIEIRVHMMKKLSAEVVYTRSLQDIWEKTDGGYKSVHKQLYWSSPFSKDLLLIQNIAPCSNVFFTRKAWDNSSNYFFNTDLSTSEDHDFWVSLSRNNYFEELEYLDTECSLRQDKTNMTGTLNFVPNWIKIFQRWRSTAMDLNYVTEAQNNILRQVNINPSDYNL